LRLEQGKDGLPVGLYGVHSYKKPMLLRYYLRPFTSILAKHFPRFCYIDGFAGPGVVRIRVGNKRYELPGSPMTAINSKPGFTDYFFCDSRKKCTHALELRCDRLAIANRNVMVLPHQDFNLCVPGLLSQIPRNCHVFAFLDPDGLELRWDTVQALGTRKYREILVNVSNGVFRCAQTAKHDAKHWNRMNSYMGTKDEWWRYKSEEILDTYKTNLKALGTGFDHVLDLPVKNRTGAIIYHLLFATDNDTAFKIAGPKMLELANLGWEQLRTLFLREQGVKVHDLYDFVPIQEKDPNKDQAILTSYIAETH
jgi:three-Cys-motif partner protein